jgi:hypothetical protein
MAGNMDLIWGKREGIYFCEGGLDRWNQLERAGEFFLCAHAPQQARGVDRVDRTCDSGSKTGNAARNTK